MENQDISKSGTDRRQSNITPTHYKRASDASNFDHQQIDHSRRKDDPKTNPHQGSPSGTDTETSPGEEIAKPDPTDPGTLYNKAMEQFDPAETRPQLAEHLVFRDQDFERDGML